MSNINKAFGRVVVNLRHKENLSQECLAWDIGSDPKYLSDVENGKRNVSLSFVNRVAEKFNVSLYEMFVMIEEEELKIL